MNRIKIILALVLWVCPAHGLQLPPVNKKSIGTVRKLLNCFDSHKKDTEAVARMTAALFELKYSGDWNDALLECQSKIVSDVDVDLMIDEDVILSVERILNKLVSPPDIQYCEGYLLGAAIAIYYGGGFNTGIIICRYSNFKSGYYFGTEVEYDRGYGAEFAVLNRKILEDRFDNNEISQTRGAGFFGLKHKNQMRMALGMGLVGQSTSPEDATDTNPTDSIGVGVGIAAMLGQVRGGYVRFLKDRTRSNVYDFLEELKK